MLVNNIINVKLKKRNYDALFNIVGIKIASKMKDDEFKYELANLNYEKYLNLPNNLKEVVESYLDNYLKVPHNNKFDELVKTLKEPRIKSIKEFKEFGLELNDLENKQNQELKNKKENMSKIKDNIPKFGDTFKKVTKKISSFSEKKSLKNAKSILYKTNIERIWKVIKRIIITIGLLFIAPKISDVLKFLTNISISGGLINTLVIVGSAFLSINDIRKIRESKATIELLNKELNNKEENTIEKEVEKEKEIEKEKVKEEETKEVKFVSKSNVSDVLYGKVEFVLNVKNKSEEYLGYLSNGLEFVRKDNNKSHKELYSENGLYKEIYVKKTLLKKLYLNANRQLILYWDIYLNIKDKDDDLLTKIQILENNYDDMFKQLEMLRSLGVNIFDSNCKVK